MQSTTVALTYRSPARVAREINRKLQSEARSEGGGMPSAHPKNILYTPYTRTPHPSLGSYNFAYPSVFI